MAAALKQQVFLPPPSLSPDVILVREGLGNKRLRQQVLDKHLSIDRYFETMFQSKDLPLVPCSCCNVRARQSTTA